MVVVPPDGGWGWVVVAASFMCNVIIDGIIFCGGALLEDMQKEFNATNSQIAPVNSLLAGFYLLAGPFVSALSNRYGFRPVTIVGSLIGSAAFAISCLATSVEFLYITYGVIGGIGFCMVYMSAVLTPGFYFEKYRSLATGLALCGSGVGTFILAPLNELLLNRFAWRMTLLVHAGLVLLCIIFGSTFRPIKPIKVLVTTEESPADTSRRRGTSADLSNSIHNLHSKLNMLKSPSTTIKVASTNQPTTAEEAFKGSSSSHAIKKLLSNTQAIEKPTVAGVSEPMKDERDTNTDKNRRRTNSNDLGARPMDRDDIFFGASLTKLPEYTSTTSLRYHLAVTRTATPPQEEERSKKFRCCPQAVKRTLATMLDVSLLRSPTFVLLALSGFFALLGLFAPFMYVKKRAESFNMDHSSSVMLVSSIGVANTIGRITCGLLSALPKLSPLWVVNITMTLGGVATILSGLSYTPAFQFTYCVIFGLSLACFASLRSILAVKYVGLNKLTNCFGLFLLFQGVGALMGSPIAGALMDYTQSYDISFYVAGSFLLISALICYPVDCVSRWEKKRNKPPSNSIT